MEEDFSGVADAQQRHGWGGEDRGGYGEHMYAMACTGVACGVRGRESSEGH